MDLSDIRIIKNILARHGFNFSKSLGQNFLINPEICPRMAAECGAQKGVGVLEIGPGVGVLTAELAKRADKVVSVELDKRLLPVLDDTLAEYGNVKIINEDILKTDLKNLIETEFSGGEVAVCANLPYYITSPVIMRFLEERLPIRSVTVMVQKEAAERLCALPGTRSCGAVSAAVRYFAEPEILFEVTRDNFFPQPNVDSAVIQLKIRKEPPVKINREKDFFALVKAAFGQRRKTVLNSVAAGLSMDRTAVASALERAEIVPNARAEQLTMEQLAALSNEVFSDE
ncbi:16S rRNA (adenine(1518)-N(6)/adenine(1519)-N(6))-dimethyltransferase RsmA [Caproiciproducens faecalis]|uniref:Ribosomal RNA small subunit methyltransferase A n=1 Tax=Caproiciproducens faecalis TaxID=2820301 RepID=A0ABS7DJY8_9FIRM|nr:16S rRNA (adenine(1518)-N(6)/adenine(1519)-N(6))-dimethyltransferase RsmA [Caproiciproducens faecalis]MBW7571600.1 16S rRNA (adenine(1518)-N(6)/adenine(1519)-N(6))-dimethyltransferase RsmA [Caproiciproducens faecalis]